MNILSQAQIWLLQKFYKRLTKKLFLLLNLINAAFCWMLEKIGCVILFTPHQHPSPLTLLTLHVSTATIKAKRKTWKKCLMKRMKIGTFTFAIKTVKLTTVKNYTKPQDCTSRTLNTHTHYSSNSIHSFCSTLYFSVQMRFLCNHVHNKDFPQKKLHTQLKLISSSVSRDNWSWLKRF